MKVKLKQKWFIRDIPFDSYGRVFVGRLYRRGEHEMPDEMYDLLPRKKDGTLVDWVQTDYKPEPEEKVLTTLSEISKKSYDEDPVRKKVEEADRTFRKKA